MTRLRSRAIGLLGFLVLACASCSDPLDEIRVLHARGQYAATVDRLRELVDEDPSRVEIHFLLGRALLHSGQAGLAVWSLHTAAESPEYAVPAGILLARAMLHSRTAPDAVNVIERVLAIDPDNVEAAITRVHAYRAAGRHQDALVEIDRLLEADPDLAALWVPRATTLIELGRIEDAERALDAARQQTEALGEAVSPQVRARLCLAQGLFAFEQGDVATAEQIYADCVERFPTDELTVTESLAFYERIGRPERATEILQRGVRESANPFLWSVLAQRMGAMGRADEQARLLREAAEAQSSPGAWFELADFHVQRNELAAALGAFESALAASPTPSPMLRFAYADTLVQAGRYDDARSSVQDLEPRALRHLILGRTHLAEGDAERALAAFEAGIALWPNNAAARYFAGQAAERLGDFDRATIEYRESLRADATHTTAGLELASLHSAHGDHPEALAAIQLYARTHPSDPAVLLASIPIAWRAQRPKIASEAVARLEQLREEVATGLAVHAEWLAERRGAAKAVEAIESAGLDLTDPDNAPALQVLADLRAGQGQHAHVASIIAAALEAHPDAAVFHELRGRALRASGAPARDSKRAFERALELDPRHAPALAGLAALAIEASDRDTALMLFDRAAASDASEPAYALAAAELESAQGWTERAASRLEGLLDRHPREARAATALALIAAERGQLDRAARLAERAAWLGEPGAEAARARVRELREAHPIAPEP